MIYLATISGKGQVTLPKELRTRLGLKPGDTLLYTLMDEGVLVTPKSTNFNDLAGLLGTPPNGPATLEQIDEAIGAQASDEAMAPLRPLSVDNAA